MKLDKLFRTAVEYKASDLYITTGCKPVFRIHGEMVTVEEHPVLTPELASEYILETMTEPQRKDFQENWDVDFALEIQSVARFRVNACMQRKGPAAYFRLIPTVIRTIDELGLPQQLKKIAHIQSGLILVTGPTGSGKSTTLASLIHEINISRRNHIITVEDPIEFVHENKKSIVDQREVGRHTKTFAKALRASLREDPDVILVGEMRDLETISLALTAAETGHVVFATLHTSGAAKSVDRIIDAFPPSQQNQIRVQMGENLRAVIWQTLLPQKGNKGRVAALEVLFNTPAVANMIRRQKTFQIPSAIETGMAEGMQTMKKSVMTLLEQGLITEEIAAANLPTDVDIG